MMAPPSPIRIEEACLNATQTQRQLFYDGWLVRVSPGKAKRARSVTAHFGSSLPLDGRPVACGQATLERDLAGVYDMVTAEDMRGRGVATLIVAELLTWAWSRGAAQAYLQVNDDNGPARSVYRKFGFETVYEYHYRARPGECR
ncbi:MAG: GNAT family N-acetyltransferase [Proteobacteria bacterium]|jgi:GNAT superfamily N-acetyltransferase|nr:GNAT family N-acetyltransferase [Pseudomonadota bacterium]